MSSLTWLLATHNQGKLRELRRVMAEYPIKIVCLDDLGIEDESPETGKTFVENALQKAMFYYKKAGGMPVLADDSGLEVDALNGAPGIHSARFGGFPTHAEKCAYLLGLLGDVDADYRTARFRCAAVYYDGTRSLDVQGSLEGYIGTQPIGDLGFGYDPIFHPELDGLSLGQIPMEEKNKISHRGKAFRHLVENLLSAGVLGK